MAKKVACNQCGEMIEWDNRNGEKMLPYEASGQRHRCPNWNPNARKSVELQEPLPRYDVPADVADTQRLTREIARLATAVEMLADEVRAMRRTAWSDAP